jgi:hypothetical protein
VLVADLAPAGCCLLHPLQTMCMFRKVTPAQQLGLKGKAAPSISVAPFGPPASESVMRERRAQAEQRGTTGSAGKGRAGSSNSRALG